MPSISPSRRTRSTPFTERVEACGVSAYTVYNHTLLATAFRSVEQDYWHLKQHVQLWDVGCERQVALCGPDASRLTQLMTCRDLSRARVGQCLYAPLVDEAGGVLNDPLILKLAEDRFWLSLADADILLWAKGLAYGLGLKVHIDEPAVTPLAVQGPQSDALMAKVFGESVRDIGFFKFSRLPFQDAAFVVARSGWSKQGGFEIYLDRPDLGAALWDALWEAGREFAVAAGCPNGIERVESGLLSYGNDMTRANNPLECGLGKYCHHERDIEFLAKPALQQITRKGIQQRIMGLRIDAQALPPCRDTWPVMHNRLSVGQVSSAVVSPELGAIAFAMLKSEVWEPGQRVQVMTPAGDTHPATVVDLPFI